MEMIQETPVAPTVGQIVANNFRTAEVFKKHGIDFCCKGGRLLQDVCSEKGIDKGKIEHELQEITRSVAPLTEKAFKDMPLDELAAYIEKTHHSYVRESIPVLLAYLDKVNKVHGGRHPELNELYMQFAECAEELTQHMVKEETILFPAIKKLAIAMKAGTALSAPFFFGKLSNPISMMEREHTTEGERFARITELCNNYTPPEDACTTYRVSFLKLEEFMNNLFTHIHLENNILFPGALKAEEAMVR
jgi:regulator of cell morphogenesis and NO signaling